MDKNFVVHERSAFTPFAVKVAPHKPVDDFKNERSQKKNAFAFIKRMFQTTYNDASSQPDKTISLK